MTNRTPQEIEKIVLDVMDSLKIPYEIHRHPPVYTVEEAEEHWKSIEGTHCKNLFVRNKKGNRHYLVILESRKRADLRELNNQLGEDRLSFGSPERLKRYLGLEPGAVSPFGLINDTDNGVQVVLDKDLKESKWVSFHPNVNTATITITFKDFEKYLEWCGNPLRSLSI
ncbi:MAG: prolyl-tRNA synthetase associated domain-containing protein [Candidatus Aminicenantes bacterium]|nr:prolyl-tRNA synthetase associated domain-containing protein [Candidatus Aminicenantes bacterium]